jgi:hypothetical protein
MLWFKSMLDKWKAFLLPRTGWKKRLLLAKSGQTVWEVPYKKDAPKVIPWPVEWIPHRQVNETDDEAAQTRGFVFLDVVCIDSGKAAPVGVGALCARCGVPLHPEAAHMLGGFSPPSCKRCYWFTFLAH